MALSAPSFKMCFLKLPMSLYYRAKFQISSIILSGFRTVSACLHGKERQPKQGLHNSGVLNFYSCQEKLVDKVAVT